MPWHVAQGAGDCDGWAVVKDSDGSIVGCHETKEQANSQLRALYANEGGDSSAEVNVLADDAEAPSGSPFDHFQDDSDKPYGDVPYADPGYQEDGKKRYPLDTEDHIRAAWSYINQQKNAAKYSSEQLSNIKGRIKAAAKRVGIEISDDSAAIRGEDFQSRLGGPLEEYWVRGAGAARIAWGTPGAFRRCVGQLREHFPRATEGLCANLYHEATGRWPGNRGNESVDGVEFDVESLIGDDESMIEASDGAWEGDLAFEGISTGDGREFVQNAITWAELPMSLKWQITDEEGHEGAVVVGRIDDVWREGNVIRGKGVFDMNGENGREAERLVRERMLRGVSIDVDQADEEIEQVEPLPTDVPANGDMIQELLDMERDDEDARKIYTAARIRAATLTPMPAFPQAFVRLVTDAPEPTGTPHVEEMSTTTEFPLSEYETRLPTKMTVSQARAAFAFVDADPWDEVGPQHSHFLHHEVAEDGTVGPANVWACEFVLRSLKDPRSTFSTEVRDATYEHIAQHLRDAGREPPPPEWTRLVASAVTERTMHSTQWFEDPRLTEPTPITVTDDGRVFGHAARWDTCHIGFADDCVTVPREDDYSHFATGEVVTADGQRVAVGQITLGTGHAPISFTEAGARGHYDDTGTAVADVAVGSDQHGIWVAGAIRDGVEHRRVHQLRAAGQVSGDWRRVGGKLRLVGLLAVNVPGFPVPRGKARIASGEPRALVAAGLVRRTTTQATLPAEVQDAMEFAAEIIATSIGRSTQDRVEELTQVVRGRNENDV